MKTRLIGALALRFALCLGVAAPVTIAILEVGAVASGIGGWERAVFGVSATYRETSARPYFNYLVEPEFNHQGRSHGDENFAGSDRLQTVLNRRHQHRRTAVTLLRNSPDAPKRSVGAWIQLSEVGVHSPAHTLANVPFTLEVPAGQTPGDYQGGIVLQTVIPTVEKRGALTFDVYQNVRHTYLSAKVAGPLHPSLAITQLSINTHGLAGLVGGPVNADVTYTLTNTGNKILNPTARLSLRRYWARRSTCRRSSSPPCFRTIRRTDHIPE